MSQAIEGLYPLIILAGVAILKGLRKRAKEKKEQEKNLARPAATLPPVQRVKVAPPPLLARVEKVESAAVSEVFYQKKKPRIAKLIGGLKSRKNLILLSEILVNKHHIN